MLVEPVRTLTDVQVAQTAEAIAARQRPDGRLPWHVQQHTDAWNHVEGAMGLTIGGRYASAERAYEWMIRSQRPDGSWAQSYAWDGSVESPDADTNMCAYVAVGAWHHYLHTGDAGFLHEMWPVVDRAIEFVLLHQAPGGEIAWNHHADGFVDRRVLLTASSSISRAPGTLIAQRRNGGGYGRIELAHACGVRTKDPERTRRTHEERRGQRRRAGIRDDRIWGASAAHQPRHRRRVPAARLGTGAGRSPPADPLPQAGLVRQHGHRGAGERRRPRRRRTTTRNRSAVATTTASDRGTRKSKRPRASVVTSASVLHSSLPSFQRLPSMRTLAPATSFYVSEASRVAYTVHGSKIVATSFER